MENSFGGDLSAGADSQDSESSKEQRSLNSGVQKPAPGPRLLGRELTKVREGVWGRPAGSRVDETDVTAQAGSTVSAHQPVSRSFFSEGLKHDIMNSDSANESSHSFFPSLMENEAMECPPTFMRIPPITPGYSGFVPYLSCQEISVDDHMNQCLLCFRKKTKQHKDWLAGLHRYAATSPQLKPVCSEEKLLRTLHDYYLQYHPLTLECKYEKKPLHEPPIPGWSGYLPRARVTELGCATRYMVMANNCYEDFLHLVEQAKQAHLKSYEEKYRDKPTQPPPDPLPKISQDQEQLPKCPIYSIPDCSCHALARPPREDIPLWWKCDYAQKSGVPCYGSIYMEPLCPPKTEKSKSINLLLENELRRRGLRSSPCPKDCNPLLQPSRM